MLGADTMKRVAAGAHRPTSGIFEPAQTIEPTTDWIAISTASASTLGTHFYT